MSSGTRRRSNRTRSARAPGVENPGRELARHLGAAIRARRLANRLTIADVAAVAEMTPGMLSKLETGQTSTSLEALARIAKGLGVSLAQLFQSYDTPPAAAQHVKSGAGMEVVRRGTRRGHTYHLLAYDRGPRRSFEPFLITLNDASEEFPRFEHSGTEFIYMLSGRIEYRCGSQSYVLEPGDSLTFHGETPHGPDRLIKLPIRFLSVIVYDDEARQA